MPYTIDMASLRKSVNQATAAPTEPKEKGKVIEAAEPVNHRPNLSDIHISDAEDSYSKTALPLGM